VSAIASAIVTAAIALARAFAPAAGRIILCGIVVRRKILRRGSVRIGLAFVRRLLRALRRARQAVHPRDVVPGDHPRGARFVMRAMPFIRLISFFSVGRLLQSLIVEPRGVGQRFTRQGFHRRTDRRRQGRHGALRLLMRMHGVVVFEIFRKRRLRIEMRRRRGRCPRKPTACREGRG